ncbi:MAG TPA: acyl-CoA thioesterase domain-containing protein [Caulobacterales bacterium]|nr:acyl-CoA thioesterase domain-containing protein [Caulobacterales bacterium]
MNREIDPAIRVASRSARIATLRRLLDDVLRVEPQGADQFLAPQTSDIFDRVYGGQMLAQALMAAAATVSPERSLHSAHCYFLRLGDPSTSIRYRVERLRDTRTFSNRLVRAEQDGACLMVVTLSFSAPSKGFAHQWPMPEAPPPEACASRDDLLLAQHQGNPPENSGVPWPIDIRYVDHRPWDEDASEGRNRIWMRAETPLPDDPTLHACLLLYGSDLTMAEPIIGRHPIRWEDLIAARGFFGASLDHSFWLHAPVRCDDWILHVQESSRAANGRGFATGRFYSRDGVLVASVAQEIFIKSTGGETPDGKGA